MKRLRLNKRGFTRCELVLSVVLLVSALFGMMVLFDNINRAVAGGARHIAAGYLARERLEGVMADKANPARGFTWVDNSNYDLTEAVTVGNSMFTRVLNIYEVISSDLVSIPNETCGFKRVDVTVSWGPEADQQVAISTIITDYSDL